MEWKICDLTRFLDGRFFGPANERNDDARNVVVVIVVNDAHGSHELVDDDAVNVINIVLIYAADGIESDVDVITLNEFYE